MKALCWHGTSDVRVDTVPDPVIADPTDMIVKITATAICGSDLHLFDGFMPTMQAGDVLGHEPMGIVQEVGKSVKNFKPGDRVVSRSRSRAGIVGSANSNCIPAAIIPIPMRRCAQGDGTFARRHCLAIRTCSAALPAAKPNICAFRMPMLAR